MFKKNIKLTTKVIDIDAGMQGNVKFNSPVNLRINGRFEGQLETKGTLIIGEKADIKAKIIKGEVITILGKVKGDIVSTNRLELSPPASVVGNIEAPILVVNEGTTLKGRCQVPTEVKKTEPKKHPKKKK